MSSTGKLELFNKAAVAASETGGSRALTGKRLAFRYFVKTTNAGAGATIQVNIEHSPNGIDWFLLVGAGMITDDDVEEGEITEAIFPNVRADITQGVDAADVLVELYFDKR